MSLCPLLEAQLTRPHTHVGEVLVCQSPVTQVEEDGVGIGVASTEVMFQPLSRPWYPWHF